MSNYKNFFKGKKITVIGLGLLGGAVNDIIFLAKHGADLTVTDLKTAGKLKPSLRLLERYPKIKFTLGKHKMEDFQDADMVLEPGNVPKNSPYLIQARKQKIPIFVSESLFAKYAPKITIVGVTGTRGKSMTTALIYEILKSTKQRVFLGGNVRSVSTLTLLDKARRGDIVVLELDSWALHGMSEIKKSPNVAVFTSFMPDHMNYYGGSMKKYFADKANIFKYQKRKDVLITNKDVKKLIKGKSKGEVILADWRDVKDWEFSVPGEHQRQNLAYAVAATRSLGVPMELIKKTVAKFKGLEGRLQYLKTVKGIKIYNDNNATTPEATIAGIKALVENSTDVGRLSSFPLILICGGADKGLNLKDLSKTIEKYCKSVILLPGSGSDKLFALKPKVKIHRVEDLKAAVQRAINLRDSGDVILFSPAFASFSQFNNEYERNDLFVKIINTLK